jgi:hypothetical protein
MYQTRYLVIGEHKNRAMGPQDVRDPVEEKPVINCECLAGRSGP